MGLEGCWIWEGAGGQSSRGRFGNTSRFLLHQLLPESRAKALGLHGPPAHLPGGTRSQCSSVRSWLAPPGSVEPTHPGDRAMCLAVAVPVHGIQMLPALAMGSVRGHWGPA